MKSEIVIKSFRRHVSKGFYSYEEYVQQLIKRTQKRFLFWTYFDDVVLDEEIVPNHVWIAMGALQFDSSNWRSKFAHYIDNGCIHPFNK